MWWKKKDKKKEEKEEVKEEDLLTELCGGDVKLYKFLSHYLYENPLTAISTKDLDSLIKEAEKSGDYSPALDKAIFETSQNPVGRERYIKTIQDLGSKTIQATEQEKEKAGKAGLNDRVSTLEVRIENHRFMLERIEDIINIASVFYKEKLVELEEDEKREARVEERRRAESDEWRRGQEEEAAREARKKERSMMGREERREAEKQDKREELAAEEMKEARAEERREAEREEVRIEEMEKSERETRRKERRGK
jgi:hypothetical protein